MKIAKPCRYYDKCAWSEDCNGRGLFVEKDGEKYACEDYVPMPSTYKMKQNLRKLNSEAMKCAKQGLKMDPVKVVECIRMILKESNPEEYDY